MTEAKPMSVTRILAFSGSTRADSLNKRLLRVAVSQAMDIGAEINTVDLADYPMPLYNGDLESSSFPDSAQAFKELMIASDGFLIATPEYNSFFSPLLKNTIDWASRRRGEEKPLAAFAGKVAGLIAASPGSLGGIRGLIPTRQLLAGIGVHVVPAQFGLSKAGQAFADDGSLAKESDQAALLKVVTSLVETSQRLRA